MQTNELHTVQERQLVKIVNINLFGVLYCVKTIPKVSYHVVQVTCQSKVGLDQYDSSMPLLKGIYVTAIGIGLWNVT